MLALVVVVQLGKLALLLARHLLGRRRVPAAVRRGIVVVVASSGCGGSRVGHSRRRCHDATGTAHEAIAHCSLQRLAVLGAGIRRQVLLAHAHDVDFFFCKWSRKRNAAGQYRYEADYNELRVMGDKKIAGGWLPRDN